MGVYCFRWRRGPWLKVGHYSRRNPWCRIARRGWASVVVPDPAIRESRPDDFELIYWSPALGGRDEAAVHRMFRGRVGEWIGTEFEGPVLDALLRLDSNGTRHGCSLAEALASRRRI
jgi:hypothetical protein